MELSGETKLAIVYLKTFYKSWIFVKIEVSKFKLSKSAFYQLIVQTTIRKQLLIGQIRTRDSRRFCERTKFLKTNKICHELNGVVQQTFFLKWMNDFTEQAILLNKQFYWTNSFTEQTVLLNKRFYPRIVQWEKEWNR